MAQTLKEYEQARDSITAKAGQAITSNQAYLQQPAIPASPTNAQLIAAVKVLRTQVDALTRQTNALIRLQLGQLEDLSDT